MSRKLFVLNGPNLDMLGEREPHLYGTTTLEEVRADCERVAAELGLELFFGQSNAESQIIDWLHLAYREHAAVVINPAGFGPRSVAILDALLILTTPIVELHISNIHARDEAHRHSLMSAAATAVIAGAGVFGYELAIRAAERLGSAGPPAASPAAGETGRG